MDKKRMAIAKKLRTQLFDFHICRNHEEEEIQLIASILERVYRNGYVDACVDMRSDLKRRYPRELKD